MFTCLRSEVSELREKCGKLSTDLELAETSRRELASQSGSADETVATLRLELRSLNTANDTLVKEVYKHRHEATTLRRNFQTKAVQLSNKLTVAEAELKRVTALREVETKTLSQSLKEAQRLGEDEIHAVRHEMELLKEVHSGQVLGLQQELRQNQESHQKYLKRLMEVLESTHVQREKETERVSKELMAVKKDKDRQIKALQREVMKLHAMQDPTSSTIATPRLPTPGRTHLLRKRLERNSDARARRSAQFDDVIQSLHSLLRVRKDPKGSSGSSSRSSHNTHNAMLMRQDVADNITEMVDILRHLYKSEEDSQNETDQTALEVIADFVAISEPDKAAFEMQQRLKYMEVEMDRLRRELRKATTAGCPACGEELEEKHSSGVAKGVEIIYVDGDDTIYG
jgi:hypothetical protein